MFQKRKTNNKDDDGNGETGKRATKAHKISGAAPNIANLSSSSEQKACWETIPNNPIRPEIEELHVIFPPIPELRGIERILYEDPVGGVGSITVEPIPNNTIWLSIARHEARSEK
jgi:hypothetical protein